MGPVQKYDAVVSFSSIEHSGLGRYGDTIDPDGDLNSMAFFLNILKPDGLLFLAVPLGKENRLEWNHHRIYGPERFRKLVRHFKLLNVDGHLSASTIGPYFYGENNWQNQPVMVFTKW